MASVFSAEVPVAGPWPAELPGSAEPGIRGVSRGAPSGRPVAHRTAADRDPVGIALLYHDTWLPPFDRLLAQPGVLDFSPSLSRGTSRTLRRLDRARPLRLAGDWLQLHGELDSPVHNLPGRSDLAEPGQHPSVGITTACRCRPGRGVRTGQRRAGPSGQCGAGYLAGEFLPHRGHAPDAVPPAQRANRGVRRAVHQCLLVGLGRSGRGRVTRQRSAQTHGRHLRSLQLRHVLQRAGGNPAAARQLRSAPSPGPVRTRAGTMPAVPEPGQRGLPRRNPDEPQRQVRRLADRQGFRRAQPLVAASTGIAGATGQSFLQQHQPA